MESFNGILRKMDAHLRRKVLTFAKNISYFIAKLSLVVAYYNFVRPHQALKFGKETRTPAQQAGLVSKRLTLREIFTSLAALILFIQRLIMTLITFSSQPRLALAHIHAVGSKRLHFTC
jgi:hypothetical protein